MSRRIVVDACVAGSSGEQNERGERCRNTLERIRRVCHRAVFSGPIAQEWKSHSHRFARLWRVSMDARKKVERMQVPEDVPLRTRIERLRLSARDTRILIKDVHLIEAARSTDSLIISVDEAARSRFSAAAARIRLLRTIIWVNPDLAGDDVLRWLEADAPLEDGCRLGAG